MTIALMLASAYAGSVVLLGILTFMVVRLKLVNASGVLVPFVLLWPIALSVAWWVAKADILARIRDVRS